MKPGLIFDLDGTLWDATYTIAPAWNRIFSEYGRTLTRGDLTKVMGMTDVEIGASLLPEADGETQLRCVREAAKAELFDLRKYGARLYPGVADTLPRLRENYDLFIVSNCMDGYIQAFFYAYGMGSLFRDFGCLSRPAQDKASNIRAICEKHGLAKAVYIGDTASDGRSARAAGLPFIHAAYGFGTAESADGVLESFPALPELLKTLGGT